MILKKLENRGNKGMVTIPFLMVSAIILFFVMAFFGLAWTLAHVSVVQYMTYSSARKYSLAGEDKTGQKGAGEKHYMQLRGAYPNKSSFFKGNSYRNNDDWLFISPDLQFPANIGKSQGWRPPPDPRLRNMFYGVTAEFKTSIAKLRIPFLTLPPDPANPGYDIKGNPIHDLEGKPMLVHSFLGREPSGDECKVFNDKRLDEIEKKFRQRGIRYIRPQTPDKGDNGC